MRTPSVGKPPTGWCTRRRPPVCRSPTLPICAAHSLYLDDRPIASSAWGDSHCRPSRRGPRRETVGYRAITTGRIRKEHVRRTSTTTKQHFHSARNQSLAPPTSGAAHELSWTITRQTAAPAAHQGDSGRDGTWVQARGGRRRRAPWRADRKPRYQRRASGARPPSRQRQAHRRRRYHQAIASRTDALQLTDATCQTADEPDSTSTGDHEGHAGRLRSLSPQRDLRAAATLRKRAHDRRPSPSQSAIRALGHRSDPTE